MNDIIYDKLLYTYMFQAEECMFKQIALKNIF